MRKSVKAGLALFELDCSTIYLIIQPYNVFSGNEKIVNCVEILHNY